MANYENNIENNIDDAVQSVKAGLNDAQNNVKAGLNDAQNNVTDMKNKVSQQAVALKEKLSDQTCSIKGKLSEQANTYGNQLADSIDNARGKTSAGLRNTSERIQSLAMYVEEHDARNMSQQLVDNTSQYIRKNPGRTMIAGLVLGLLVGRVFGLFQSGKNDRG